ncbi:MAG: hypothetical protein ACR652_21405 [Methylocystis sp.]|uniref:hypothetical protein n=1 Tax=Methylocystis sp. TaxID=1911079 RepID=UPI003DA30CE7
MTIFWKGSVLAGHAAVLFGAVCASAQAGDVKANQRAQIEFLQKYAAPARLTPPPAALTTPHASAPQSLPPPSASTSGGGPRAFAPSAAPTAAPAVTAGAATTAAFAGGTTAVYFSAHPDDFVLFSLPYRDVAADARAVFIFVTAGDGGLGAGPTNAPYYLARENAALKSIRFMADAARPWAEKIYTVTATVNGHLIYKFWYRSSVAYFLRLPDGNGAGEGFPGTGNTSIVKLHNGEVSTLKAINNSTTYKGWADLAGTVTAIVKAESAGSPNVWLNANDFDESKNPGDHFDHYATGALAAAVQKTLPCVNAAYYVGYSLAGVSNLSKEDALNKTGSFASYATGLTEKNYFGAWDSSHKAWLNGLAVRTAMGNGAACAN